MTDTISASLQLIGCLLVVATPNRSSSRAIDLLGSVIEVSKFKL
jgi:hypothetical protein